MTFLDRSSAHVAQTTPYAWPYNGDLTPARTAVAVVHAGGWAAGASERDGAAIEVVDAVRSAGGVVFAVHTAPPRGAVPSITPPVLVDADVIVTSGGIDGFYASAFDAELRLRGIERIVLVGHGTETAVHSTMRTANDAGYECILVADACTPYDPSLEAASISMIEMSGGIFGAVGTAANVITAFTPPRASAA